MINLFKILIIKFKDFFISKELRLLDNTLILQAKLYEKSLFKNKIKSLSDAEFSVYSQFGEDGILSYLINVIPNMHRSFIEFGVQDYFESNTRYILQSKNWDGLIIDGSQDNISKIKSSNLFWKHNLDALCLFITKDNINSTLKEFSQHVGILSIDIDGNDYWVWDSIVDVEADIVVVEYNSLLGDQLSITVPYSTNFDRKSSNYSHLYFGCSIQSLIKLGKDKGYIFLGTSSNGINAFFVKEKFSHYFPPDFKRFVHRAKVRESRDMRGKLSHTCFKSSYDYIKYEYFFCTKESQTIKCPEPSELYSEEWVNVGFVEL